jgi:hypothetical protein
VPSRARSPACNSPDNQSRKSKARIYFNTLYRDNEEFREHNIAKRIAYYKTHPESRERSKQNKRKKYHTDIEYRELVKKKQRESYRKKKNIKIQE